MRHLPRMTALVATSTILAVGLAGCGSGESNGNGKAPITLNIWTFAQDYQQLYNTLAPSFEKLHPDVRIHAQLMDLTALASKYQVVRTSGGIDAPDLVDVEQGTFPQFMRGRIPFVPLNSYMKAEGLETAESPGRQALYTYDGRVYGVEHSACAVALYYRADLFAKAGIDVSKLKTWDQFMQAARKAAGQKQYVFPSNDPWDSSIEAQWEMLLKQAGGDVVNGNGQITFDSPKSIQVLSMLKSWQQNHLEDSTHPQNLQFWAAFKQGRYVATFGPDWWANMLVQQVPSLKGKWAAMPLPSGGPGWMPTSDWGGTGLMLSRFSQHQQLAWEFLKYSLLTRSSLLTQYKIDENFPSMLKALNQPALYKPNGFTAYFAASGKSVTELFKQLVPVEPPQHQAWWRPLFYQAWNQWEYQFTEGQLTPADFLGKVKATLEELIQKNDQ